MRWEKPELELLCVGMEVGAYRSPHVPWPVDEADEVDGEELKRGAPRGERVDPAE